MDNNSNNNDDDADYIEDLHGDGGSAGPSAMSSASLSLQDLDLSRLAVASSKPQRRQRPAGHTHSLPQKSKSAGLATSTSTSTNTSTNTRATPGRPPLRHKSGDLPVSRSSAHRDLSSKSAHAAVGVDAAAAADDWFDFDSGPTPTPIPKHSTASNKSYSSDDTTGEIEGSSFHGEDSRRSSLRLRDRREMARTISEKRLSSTAVTDIEPSPASTPPSRGLARSKSGVPRLPHNSNHRTPPTRVPPTRSRSDALTSSRRESMKALYRTTGNLDEASSSPQLLTSIGKGADGDSTSTVPRQRPRPQRAASGLEAGALSSVIMDRRPPTRSRSTDSANLFSTQEGNNEDSDDEQNQPHDPKWLQRRQSKQDEIMTLAQDVKERFADAREKQEELEYNATTSGGGASGNVDDDLEDDDDQPMAMRTKKTVLEQIKKVANKTGAGARSLGKGTVNAIHDPKLAAKRLGHLSKDVGKATIKTALDPSKLAKGAKNMTVGSAKMGAGLTKGVAKTTFGATKTVVKGGVSATTKSAMLTMKGTKKVVKGTVRAVKGHHKQKHETEEEYNARNLADRNQATLYDRVSSMVESTATTEEDDNLEEAILAGIAAAESGGDKHNPKAAVSKSKGSSILMPTNLMGSSSRGNWDV